jgi:hypothetical protein
MSMVGGNARAHVQRQQQTNEVLSELTEIMRDVKATQRAATAALEAFAYNEASLLPGRVAESGSVVFGQQVSKLSTSTSTVIEAQTTDVEIIEGIYATVNGLSSGGIVGVSFQLTDEIVFPFVFLAGQPQIFLAPMSIPVQQYQRVLSVTGVVGSYISTSVLMWGHVAPARTRVVH